MFINKLKKELYDGKTCFGTFKSLNSTDVIEAADIVLVACKK